MISETISLKDAIGKWLQGWYNELAVTTAQLAAYKAKGFSQSVGIVSGRMVDQVEEMLESYRRNENNNSKNNNSLFPIVFVAVAKDITATGGDWGGRQIPRQFVKIIDADDASIYGYRQVMEDARLQIVIMATEESTAKSLGFQLVHFLGLPKNRQFEKEEKWYDYDLTFPVMIESPDVILQSMPTDQKNMTILSVDLTLKEVIGYFDAPGENDPNDGSNNVPPGYPFVTDYVVVKRTFV